MYRFVFYNLLFIQGLCDRVFPIPFLILPAIRECILEFQQHLKLEHTLLS
jgi:hypothetical protein